MAYDATEHRIGFGKKLEYAAVEAMTSAVQIFGTQDIQLPEREVSEQESTNDSSPDYHREFVMGLVDPGEVSFSYVYSKTEYAKVEALLALANVTADRLTAKKWWRVTLPDQSTALFQGWVKKNDLPTEVDGLIVCEASIKVTGKMTFTAYDPG